MRIGLWTDSKKFPNLALMKCSTFYKQGSNVEWVNPDAPKKYYDNIFASKIFTFTKEPDLASKAKGYVIRGGTGYRGIETLELPKRLDKMQPDYSIYPDCDYAVGFLTRGCIRNCPWCIVPRKEGMIHPYRDWREIKRDGLRDMVLLDNNVLACDYGIQQIESMIGQDVRIDFNQGLDARLITDDVAEILSKVKWRRFIRMSCDTDAMLDTVVHAVERLGRHGVKPYRIFCYLLVQDIESAEHRAIALRNLGVDVFAQPYRDFENKIEPTKEQKDFARWVNRKAIFKSCPTFADYSREKG